MASVVKLLKDNMRTSFRALQSSLTTSGDANMILAGALEQVVAKLEEHNVLQDEAAAQLKLSSRVEALRSGSSNRAGDLRGTYPMNTDRTSAADLEDTRSPSLSIRSATACMAASDAGGWWPTHSEIMARSSMWQYAAC